jgi:hypothetical protein
MDEKSREAIEVLNERRSDLRREFWACILGLASVLFSFLKWGLPGFYVSIAVVLLLAFTFEGLRRLIGSIRHSRTR